MSCLLRVALVTILVSVTLCVACAPRIASPRDASKPAEAPQTPPPASGGLVGGRCEYADYAGIATISRVEKTADSLAQIKIAGGAGYEGYEVRFTFKSDQHLPDEWRQRALESEHSFQLANSWYVGPEYLAKYKIEPGATFPCTLRIITKGTCTPMLFAFDNLDQTDYFEARQ